VPNRIKSTASFRAQIAEVQAAALERVELIISKKMPLEFLLEVMRDETYPPATRIEAAKAALPFCHAKMAEKPVEQTVQIHEIRRVIVDPAHGTETTAELAARLNGDETTEVVRRTETTTADPIRDRMSKMRGFH
jgi:hypothetical protein